MTDYTDYQYLNRLKYDLNRFLIEMMDNDCTEDEKMKIIVVGDMVDNLLDLKSDPPSPKKGK